MIEYLIVYNSLVKGFQNYVYRNPWDKDLDINKIKEVIEKEEKVKDIVILNIVNLSRM